MNKSTFSNAYCCKDALAVAHDWSQEQGSVSDHRNRNLVMAAQAACFFALTSVMIGLV